MLPIPIKQYKDYRPRSKCVKAEELSQWLLSQQVKGLILKGFFHAHTLIAAANLGLRLIQELPNTRVETHYGSYRLYFGDEQIDFAQAIALEYYFFTINFGIRRAISYPKNPGNSLLLWIDFLGQTLRTLQPDNLYRALKDLSSSTLFTDIRRLGRELRQIINQQISKADLAISTGGGQTLVKLGKKGRLAHISFYLIGWLLQL